MPLWPMPTDFLWKRLLIDYYREREVAEADAYLNKAARSTEKTRQAR